MRTSARILAGLAALAFSGVVAPTPALAAAGDVTWTVRTASNSFGAARSSFSYAVNPGGVLRDAMVVTNRGKTPLDLGVYAADGFTTEGGQLDVGASAQKPIGIGAWTKSGGSRFAVAPGKSVQVPFTLTIPANATPGDHVGAIVTSLTGPDQAAGINVERRLGIRIKLRVAGDLKPTLAVEDLHVGFGGSANPVAAGDATVSYTIHNTGNAVLSARQAVTVSGPFGKLRADAAAIDAAPDLLPGESWKVSVPIHDVAPSVRLAATATLTPVIADASGSTTALDPIKATTHGWAVSWTLLVLIVVLILAVLLYLRLRTRRKQREDARVQEAVESALRASAL